MTWRKEDLSPKAASFGNTEGSSRNFPFLEMNPNFVISFSKFAAVRCSCLCKYHENIRLLLQALSQGGLDVPTSFRDFIALIVCHQSNERCIDGTCENRPGIQKLVLSESDGTVLEWQQRSVELGKVCKIVHKGPVAECFDELSKQVPYFLQQRGPGRWFCWITG